MTNITNKKINFYIYIILAAVTFAVYLRVISNGFVNYDDNKYITENPYTQSGLNLNSIKWAFEGKLDYWNPLTLLSHTLDCQLFGLNPAGHHMVNLLFHIINVLLLFGTLRMMTGAVWQSAFVAVIFAIHPLNVESVAWISERKNVLSTMFWLLTICSYWKYSKALNIKWYLLTLLFFVMGLMSKPMVVTLPFILLLLDYWPIQRLKSLSEWKTEGKLLVEKIPFFVLSAILCVITFLRQKAVGTVATIDEVPFSIRLTNAVVSYGKYITKEIWPTKLAVLYPLLNEIVIWEIIVSAAGLVAISIFIIKYGRKSKYLLVGWLWYLGTLVPMIGIIQVGKQAMADRYVYVPMIGLFIIIGWGICELTEQWVHRKIILKISAGGVIGALSILTFIQVGYWKNSITLFEHTLAAAARDSHLIHYYLGAAYIDNGEYEKAKSELDNAIRIKPDYADAYNSLGIYYYKVGHYEEAIAACNQAIRMNPNDGEAYNNLGIDYYKLGRYEEAEKAYKQAISINPDFAEAYNNLGSLYGTEGYYEKLIEACKAAIKIKPNYAEAYYNLCIGYDRLGRYQESIEACKQMIQIKPDYAEAYLKLGIIYGKVSCYEDAINSYKQAIKINPNLAEAYNFLSRTYLIIGDKESALEEYKIFKILAPEKSKELFDLINK